LLNENISNYFSLRFFLQKVSDFDTGWAVFAAFTGFFSVTVMCHLLLQRAFPWRWVAPFSLRKCKKKTARSRRLFG